MLPTSTQTNIVNIVIVRQEETVNDPELYQKKKKIKNKIELVDILQTSTNKIRKFKHLNQNNNNTIQI